GITRLQRYYDPLRLPQGAHRRGYGALAPPPMGLPRCPYHLIRRAVPTTPADRMGASVDCLPTSVLHSPVSEGLHPLLALSRPAQALRSFGPPLRSTASAAFVTRLQRQRLPPGPARQLPVQSTILRVDPSSTGDTRPRGAPRRSRSGRYDQNS